MHYPFFAHNTPLLNIMPLEGRILALFKYHIQSIVTSHCGTL